MCLLFPYAMSHPTGLSQLSLFRDPLRFAAPISFLRPQVAHCSPGLAGFSPVFFPEFSSFFHCSGTQRKITLFVFYGAEHTSEFSSAPDTLICLPWDVVYRSDYTAGTSEAKLARAHWDLGD